MRFDPENFKGFWPNPLGLYCIPRVFLCTSRKWYETDVNGVPKALQIYASRPQYFYIIFLVISVRLHFLSDRTHWSRLMFRLNGLHFVGWGQAVSGYFVEAINSDNIVYQFLSSPPSRHNWASIHQLSHIHISHSYHLNMFSLFCSEIQWIIGSACYRNLCCFVPADGYNCFSM